MNWDVSEYQVRKHSELSQEQEDSECDVEDADSFDSDPPEVAVSVQLKVETGQIHTGVPREHILEHFGGQVKRNGLNVGKFSLEDVGEDVVGAVEGVKRYVAPNEEFKSEMKRCKF